MDDVIIFDKSFQERLNEYQEVLSGKDVLPVSQIQKDWAFFIDLTVDRIGWQAIWKIPRLKCEEFKISFPTIVLTLVENVDGLEALVKVMAVEDDISIPEKHYVPLIQLWPTKDQDPTVALRLDITANTVDMVRFFYQNVFMPWDYEEDDTTDWLGKHLESRLRLYYDMKNGIIPKGIGEYLRSLITEAKRLEAQRELLERELQEAEEIDEMDLNHQLEDEKLQKITELYVRIIEIGSEVKLLENPLTRKVVMKRQQKIMQKDSPKNCAIYLVGQKGLVNDYCDFLKQVEKEYPNEEVLVVDDLTNVLVSAKNFNTILLSKGNFLLKTVISLENGTILKGIFPPDQTLLVSNQNLVMDFLSENVLLENLTIDVSSSQCGIVIRSGKLTLKNCRIVGNAECSVNVGIIVLSGGYLEMIGSQMSKFATAIIGNSFSKISLKNCEIFNANCGIRTFDNCTLKAKNTSLHDCKEFGLCVITDKCLQAGDTRSGNFDVLQIIPDIQIQEMKGENNNKGNAIIMQKPKIVGLKDIFTSEYETGSTSQEEMDSNSIDFDDTITNVNIENIGQDVEM